MKKKSKIFPRKVFPYLFLGMLLLFPVIINAQSSEKITLSGLVTDNNNVPLIGVTVAEKGTSNGTSTDLEGRYTIKVRPNSVMRFSFLSFKTQEVNVINKTTINVSLNEDLQSLNEVVVIGYGSLDKKEVTSAVSHISSKDFLSVSSVDPTMMIQGKVAGVSITNTGVADPNNQASIQIRGISSRAAGLGPLIVLDGVPGADLTNINSNDIASMDILKDGAASAIYGTRGSNGVVVITTKKGARDGRVHTTYNSMMSLSIPLRELDPLTSAEFREYHIAGNPAKDQGGDTDWLSEITRTGFAQQHTLTLSGGSNKSNYRASVDYKDSEGIDLRSGRQEYGARISINQASKSGLFDFAVNIAPRIINRENSSWDAFKMAMDANPTTPVYSTENPGLFSDFMGQEALWNPMEELKLEQNGGETKLLEWDATAKLNLLPILAKEGHSIHSLSTQITFADHQSDNFDYMFRPSTSNWAKRSGFSGEASRRYSKFRQNSLEWLGNYSMELEDHRVKAMAGYSYQYIQESGLFAENKDFSSDILTYNNLNTGDWAKEEGRSGMSTWKNDSKLIAFFGRLSYDYKEKYLATASLRYEGSSKFGANNKWGYFPAVSAGWRISEEDFMNDISWIDELKIRADYGVTGNQNFGNYLSLSTMQSFGSYYYNGSYYTVWGPGKNPNPNLKWEKGKNWNAGVDFSLLNNVISASVNYYYRKQQDLLGDYNVPVPPYLYTSSFVNVGTMRNSGVEVDLNIHAIKTKDFNYNVGLVGSSNDNKFINFSNSEFVGQGFLDVGYMESPNQPGRLQRIEEGKRIGNYRTWKYAGIDKDGDWVVWNKDNTEMIKISDAKEEDKRITGNGLPKFTASMNNNFTYKNWGLTVFLRGAFGFDIFNVHDFYYGLPVMQSNVISKAYGKNAAITKGKNMLTDYFIESGDYVKLDMVTLNYTFNIKNKWLESVRLYATGKNLATFTGFSGVDPSTYQTNGLTPGMNLNGTEGTRRYYPSATQIIFGVQVDF